jgi:hypothetical protein
MSVTNAFNTRNRAWMLHSLFSRPSLAPVFRAARSGDGNGTPLMVYENGRAAHTLASTAGSRQGCILGSLLFEVDVHNAYLSTQHAFLSVHLVAIHDEVYIAGRYSEASPADALTYGYLVALS